MIIGKKILTVTSNFYISHSANVENWNSSPACKQHQIRNHYRFEISKYAFLIPGFLIEFLPLCPTLISAFEMWPVHMHVLEHRSLQNIKQILVPYHKLLWDGSSGQNQTNQPISGNTENTFLELPGLRQKKVVVV